MMESTIRILGIDPGSRITGFGVIEVSAKPDRCAYVVSGCIRMQYNDMMSRMREIFDSVHLLVCEHKPEEIAIERVFVHRNADSALKLGQARAAALCASFPQDIPVFEFAPREIKLAVVGRGGAEKSQVQHMVKIMLSLEGDLQADAADALAVALCRAGRRSAPSLQAARAIGN